MVVVSSSINHFVRRKRSLHKLASLLRNPRYAAAFAVGLLTVVYSVDRMLAYRINTQEWVMAPITFLNRTCPAPSYQLQAKTNGDPKICLTTLTDARKADWLQRHIRWRNMDNLLEMTWPNKKEYCEKHGYHLFDESENLDTTRPPSWSKVVAARRLLTQEHCDWVFWMDADTVIMNSNQRVQDFLPETQDFVIAPEKRGGYNAGVWVIKNTPWSIRFLDEWYAMESFVQPKGMATSGDNEALKSKLLGMDKTEFAQHVAVPERCEFNSVAMFLTKKEARDIETGKQKLEDQIWYHHTWKYHKGDFVAHVAGTFTFSFGSSWRDQCCCTTGSLF